MITVDGLTVEFGGTTLFKDISFQINEKDRIALMGKNGAGKSTLLKIIAGVRNATRGSVSAPKDCVIAYLPQHLMTEDGRTVFEETCQAFAHLHEMQAEIDRINNELTTRTDYDSDDYMQLIEKVSSLSEKFYAIDMTHFEEDVEKTLLGLGFERSDFNRPTSEFSGGWRMRIELAKLLLKSPDVLLLDEPTNHLDMQSKDVLKEAIKAFDGTAIIVSHDREFLDGLVDKVYEFGGGKVREHLGGIYDYLRAHNAENINQALANQSMASAGSPSANTSGSSVASGSIADSLASATSGKQSYAEHKEQQKKIRKAEKAVKECEAKIEKLEARKKEIDELLMKPENATNMELVTEYTELMKGLDEENERWMLLSEELEEVSK